MTDNRILIQESSDPYYWFTLTKLENEIKKHKANCFIVGYYEKILINMLVQESTKV